MRWLPVLALVLSAVACTSSASPESASNAVIRAATDGKTGELPGSYERLCKARRDAVSLEEFERTSGEAVSPIFTRHGWGGVDGTEQPDDVKTLDPAVTEATRVYRVQRKTGPGGLDFMYEEWKISLVREDDKWRLCGFEMLESYPLVQDYETRCPNSKVKGCP